MNARETFHLTEKFEDLSTDQYWKFRFFCDACQETATLAQLPKLSQNQQPDADSVLEIMSLVKLDLRRCPRCKKWVCRESCWHPIQCLCETCSGAPFQETSSGPGGEPETVYSSILGALCLSCETLIEPGKTVCPDCGEEQSSLR